MKVVKVKWLDSYGGGLWVDKDDFTPEVTTCVSIGFEVERTDDYVALASTVSEDQILSPICIPICSVLEIKYTGEPQKLS